MITGAIKNKVDAIWKTIWTGGITNPLTVIEQLSYIMFIRGLDERERENEANESVLGIKTKKIFPQTETGQSMRWSIFKNFAPDKIVETIDKRVFPAIKNMKAGRLPDFDKHGEMIEPIIDDGAREAETDIFSAFMDSAVFLMYKPEVLQPVITKLDDLYTNEIKKLDMMGDLYEYMLSKIETSGTNGQFRTPRHIREMMVKLVEPTPDDLICDPACGTAGFLNSASDYIRDHYGDTMTDAQWEAYQGRTFTGFDTDVTMLRISAMNLMLNSITRPNIVELDSLSKRNKMKARFTLCLANPPFSGTLNTSFVDDDLLTITNTKKTELLFISLFIRMLAPGGRCACIVPDGVLFGASKAHKAIRRVLVEEHKLTAVISMPSGVFKPYAGVSTAVLVFTKTGAGGTDGVWFYDMTADGYTLDDKRSETAENDIPDIIARFKALNAEGDRSRSDKSFVVPKDEIAANGYDLSINKYRRTEYEAVVYDPPHKILDEIEAAEREITDAIAELREMM